MKTEEKIIEEIKQLTEEELVNLLEYIHSLKRQPKSSLKEKIWLAYLESEQEREEVYQRLANS